MHADTIIKNEKVYEILYHNTFFDWKLADLVEWKQDAPLHRALVMRRDVFERLFRGHSASLPRHQDLLALYPELFFRLGDRDPRRVAFVSHRWESKEQPDPQARQLGLL